MAQAEPVPATVAPHRALRRPNLDLMRMATRWLMVTARSILSSGMSFHLARATVGMVAVMPWLPLPELATTE